MEGQSFKEYIRDELHSFAAGMSKALRKTFGYVVVSGGAMTELLAEFDALNI
jgi:hypothetical protein